MRDGHAAPGSTSFTQDRTSILMNDRMGIQETFR